MLSNILILLTAALLCMSCTANPTLAFTPSPSSLPSAIVKATATPIPTTIPTPTHSPKPSVTPTITSTTTSADPRDVLAPGLHIVYWSQNALYLSSLDAPLGIRLATIDDPNASLSPSGDRIAFSRRGVLYLYDFMHQNPIPLPEAGAEAYAPQWSPNGDSLVYTYAEEPPWGLSIRMIQLDNNVITPITTMASVERSATWSPDGNWIALASDQVNMSRTDCSCFGVTEIYLIDTRCLKGLTDCEAHMQQITDMGPNGHSDSPAWSPDSHRLAFVCGDLIQEDYQTDICVINSDGTNFINLTQSAEDELDPSWSPDGQWIAFTYEDASSREGDVFVVPAEGGESKNIMHTPEIDERFVFWLEIK